MATKKIVVLGAGYGGVLTAKKLAKKFKNKEDVSITIIDKNSHHTMLTELHEVAANRVPEEAIRIDLAKIFAGRNVDIVLDEILNIDFEKKELQGKIKNYTYDYLVKATGSKPTFFGCNGADEHALTLWSYDDAVRIKHHILDIMSKASVEKDPVKRSHLLTFTVIGCGATGIEMIGELAEWKDKLCKKFAIDSKDVTMYVIDMLPKILPTLDDKLIRKAEKRLEKLGVQILTQSGVIEVQKNLVRLENKGCIHTYTTIWAAGIEGSDLMEELDLEKNGRNRIVTDSYLRAIGQEDAFVVGDNIFFIPEGEGKPVPQMVENAEHSSDLVAKNIVRSINGQELLIYKPTFHGSMVCIGGKYGVAQVGTGKRDFRFSGFPAMFIKHFINVIYFIQVAGFTKVWTYLMHEFFFIEDGRSFLGGHFSKRSPNFWLVPLRIFLGVKWFLEGWRKLPSIIDNPNDIFLIPQKIVDVTSASVEGAAEWGAALPVPGFIANLVEWSMDLVFYTPDGGFTGLATVFQTFMVLAEIAVGLALIGGLFTALASIASVAMGLMIWASGLAPYEMLWYIFGGVATIGGSGSTFGLDYYVLPYLKERWGKCKFVKKWYLYSDY
ncbi:MAG: FAD-dependent oxidoreductase [Peptostreptococcales bacterium]|jgi:NADH dehydrogenase